MLQAVDTKPIIAHRYEIQHPLGQGGMGIVYRAFDRLSRRAVALKQVVVGSSQLAFSSLSQNDSTGHRMALAREFQLLASLRHPYIISVLDYGFDEQQQPFFTMSLLQHPRHICQVAPHLDLDGRVDLLVQMLQALAYLHRRGIIHRDLKPGNVLVDDAGRLQVVDFGLALQQEQVREMVGTLAYMAPEVLQGKSVTPAADLYSAGVIAYEVLTGSHPFETKDLTRLMAQLLHEAPDLDRLPEAMQPVVACLLQKEPQRRFANAFETIHAMQTAVDRPPLPETGEVRESFLQAATFIGREQELKLLTGSLRDIREGYGRFWLVGGESGVGKTRLLEEVRTEALVRGALVVRGQAISEGAAPFRMFHNVLRQLCLRTTLTDLEAGVIKPLAPDIGMLLGRDVPDAPELEAEATQRRLLTVIEQLFRRQKEPMVLLLEDLQWAEESTDIVRYLTERLIDQPVLIIGSYRDDEYPNLPTLLPQMQVLKLERFTRQTVKALSVSMLGEVIGSQEHIIRLLMQETEGNVYFLVEVVRALAEEAGQLDQIGQITLPQYVFAQGVRTVLARRLNRVLPEARPLLKLAAIRGRLLDLPLLQAMAPTVNLDAWLRHGNDTAVLEIKDQVWQFSHDKLREALLAQMDPYESQQLHRQVAKTIETIYPDDPTQVLVLAYQWHMAGDAARELPYRLAAGEMALASGANSQAVDLLTRAFDLSVSQQASQAQQAHVLRLLGEAYMGLGDLPKARLAFAQTAGLLDSPVPASAAATGSGFAFQFGRQLGRLIRPARPTQDPQQQFRYRELLHAYRLLGEICFLNNETMPAMFATVRALNVVERLPPGPEQAMLYSNMSVAAALMPWHYLARLYQQKALTTIKALGVPNLLAECHVSLALAVYKSVLAHWEDCEQLSAQAVALGQQIGDYRTMGGALNVQATTLFNQGRHEQALALYRQMYDTAVSQHNLIQQGWGLVNQATCLLRLGRDPDGAYQWLTEARMIQHQVHDAVAELNIYATMATLHIRQQRMQEALHAAATGLKLLVANATSIGSYVGFHNVPLVYLALWEGGHTAVIPDARAALKRLKRYARIFHFARPAHHICQSWQAWLEGRPALAKTAGQKAIAAAHAVQMPYEEGLAHYHLARFLPEGAPEKLAHYHQAETLWKATGAAYMLTQLP